MKVAFIEKEFRKKSLAIIDQANEIIEEYLLQGYDLTLRQLFYQFVSRDLIPNTQREYKKLGSVISDARLAGLIDWNSIVDRLRKVEQLSFWGYPQDIIRASAKQFRVDMWSNQDVRVEVWIEKDALAGVIEGVCNKHRVPYLACRGYVSQSAMYQAALRIGERRGNDQETIILHLGDHDPSGIDMTRDIKERLRLLSGIYIDVRRLALNMDEVEEFNPPPNPAKLTDSRSQDYITNYGEDSWELDALEPSVIVQLIEEEIESLREDGPWLNKQREETSFKRELKKVSTKWKDVMKFLEEKGK